MLLSHPKSTPVDSETLAKSAFPSPIERVWRAWTLASSSSGQCQTLYNPLKLICALAPHGASFLVVLASLIQPSKASIST